MPQPDRSVSLAQVGFALSLAACLTALVALASAFGGGFDFGIGGGIVLIAAVTPVAGAGAILARLSRTSPSHRRLMRAALLLSCLVFASLLALLALLFYGLAVFCPHACI